MNRLMRIALLAIAAIGCAPTPDPAHGTDRCACYQRGQEDGWRVGYHAAHDENIEMRRKADAWDYFCQTASRPVVQTEQPK